MKVQGCWKEEGTFQGNVYGTYVHGIFDHAQTAGRMVEILAKKKGVLVDTSSLMDYKAYEQLQYDKLAAGLRDSLDMPQIYGMLTDAKI